VSSVSGEHYYESLGEGWYRPTKNVQGAWNEHEQHMSPVAGLLAHAVESHHPRPDLQLSRICYDIYGLIPLADGRVRVRTVRPGRSIELLEAVLEIDGRIAVRASAWRLGRYDTTAVAGGLPPSLPPAQTMPGWPGRALWDGGYIDSLIGLKEEGSRPGCGRVWIRSDVDLVAGQSASPTARFLRLVDTANGIATRVSPREWLFPNVDLTVHLFRAPSGPWVGFDTSVTFGADGLGLTSSWLHDEHGPVGRAEQTLTVRAMPARGS
jgi:hypothetical protein